MRTVIITFVLGLLAGRHNYIYRGGLYLWIPWLFWMQLTWGHSRYETPYLFAHFLGGKYKLTAGTGGHIWYRAMNEIVDPKIYETMCIPKRYKQ